MTFVVTTLVLAPPELPLLDVLEDSQQPLHPTRRIFPSIYQCGFSTVYRTRIKFLLQKKRGVFYLFFFFLFFFTNGETRFFYSPDFQRRKREGKKAADAIDRSQKRRRRRDNIRIFVDCATGSSLSLPLFLPLSLPHSFFSPASLRFRVKRVRSFASLWLLRRVTWTSTGRV